MTILDQIIADKRQEVVARRQVVPIAHLERLCQGLKPGRSMKQALLDSSTGIISEFKRKSPSKGMIHPNASAPEVTSAYQKGGCSAVSVLTDYPHFGGTVGDFKTARGVLDCPMLRKDFIVDPYQVYESKVLGADVILLIAAALDPGLAYDLGELADQLGMEVLLEVHEEQELEYVSRFTGMVGVNNRNLKTFEVDLRTSFDLAEKIPADRVKISESGLSDAATVRALRDAGYRGFLMGENFMKQPDPGAALAAFVKELETI